MKHIKAYIHYLMLTLLSIWGGCQDEPLVPPESATGNDVSFVLRIPAPDIPVTRTMDGAKEHAVEEVAVLVFQVNGSNQTFAYYKEGTHLEMSSGSPYTAEFRAQLTEGNNYNIAIIANPGATLKSTLSALSAGTTKAAVLEALKYSGTAGQPWPADGSGTSGTDYLPIPMYGETGTITITSGTTISGITLTRMLARIDVSVDLGSSPENTFRLTNIYVCNYNTVGYVAPGTTIPNIPANPGKQTGQAAALNYTVSGATAAAASYNGEIYTFETAAADESTTLSFYNSICLVLRGSFNGEDTYYRVNFTYDGDPSGSGGTKGNFMPLIRNYKYEVKVTEVKRVGYKSLNEAIQSFGTESNDRLKYQTISYDLGNITDMVFDGQYLLGTDVRNRKLMVGPSGISAKTFTVYTDYPQGYSVEKVYDVKTNATPDWLTYTSPGGTGTKQIELNADPTDTSREAQMVLRAGRLRDTVTISQKMASNCYILLPGEEVEIPVYAAYEVWRDHPHIINNIDLSNVTPTAKLLWKDVKGNIIENQTQLEVLGSGSDSSIRVKAGTVPGNAVVAMYTDNETIIRWSWHIWVVDPADPPKAVGGSGPNNLPWLDRNLGAPDSGPDGGYGLLYQWGRKDPFVGGTALSPGTLKSMYSADDATYPNLEQVRDLSNMLAYSIHHPSTFIRPNIINEHWINSSTVHTDNIYLWVNNSGAATAFDPCPEGYRIPVRIDELGFLTSPWLDATVNSSWLTGVYLPDHGGYYINTNYRHPNTPLKIYTTQTGIVWSGSVRNNNIYVLGTNFIPSLPAPEVRWGNTSFNLIPSIAAGVRCQKQIEK